MSSHGVMSSRKTNNGPELHPVQTTLVIIFKTLRGTAMAHWLRCCASNRKVAGSIPAGVNGFFIDVKPSDRTMALGSTQPLTEMSTASISWG
jgi:hypothetical protein